MPRIVFAPSRRPQPTPRPTHAPKELTGITRMDFERATGWLVRVYRGGDTHSKFFADGKYGGKAKALQQARQYKRRYERQHPAPSTSGYPSPFLPTSRTIASSGVRGVSETYDRTSTGKKLRCFSVTYTLKGKRKNRRFYHHQYPSRQVALKAATQFRHKMEKAMGREYQQRLHAGQPQYSKHKAAG